MKWRSSAATIATGGAEDLKGVTALLATDAGAFITGQTIAVDGGLTAVF